MVHCSVGWAVVLLTLETDRSERPSIPLAFSPRGCEPHWIYIPREKFLPPERFCSSAAKQLPAVCCSKLRLGASIHVVPDFY